MEQVANIEFWKIAAQLGSGVFMGCVVAAAMVWICNRMIGVMETRMAAITVTLERLATKVDEAKCLAPYLHPTNSRQRPPEARD